MSESNKSAITRAFEAGATNIRVHTFGDDFHATITSFRMTQDGNRSTTASANVEGRGATADEAIEAALSQLLPNQNELASTSTEIVQPREVLQPEIMDPPLRYALPDRPGQFVTRKQALERA